MTVTFLVICDTQPGQIFTSSLRNSSLGKPGSKDFYFINIGGLLLDTYKSFIFSDLTVLRIYKEDVSSMNSN